MGCIRGINQLLCKNINKSTIRYSRHDAKYLGIGYLRNKEMWNKLRRCNLNGRQFNNVVTGKNDAINGFDYYLHENNDMINNTKENIDKEVNQNPINNDKEINTEMNNKDQIVNININSRQRAIEDAWS